MGQQQYARAQKVRAHVKMKHPRQVEPQMKNTFTPKLAVLTPLIPVVEASTRYGVAYPIVTPVISRESREEELHYTDAEIPEPVTSDTERHALRTDIERL
jgi:hypothetical protein